MKNKIFMYLFLFSVLLIIFLYMNEKSIFETQERKLQISTDKVNHLNDSLDLLHGKVADLNYFSLQGNDNAMSYLENLGYNAAEVEALVSNQIYSQNSVETGNPLIPFEGMNGTMKINKLKFLNHKWIVADFTDGKYWGEIILEYNFNDKNELVLNTIASLLYPPD